MAASNALNIDEVEAKVREWRKADAAGDKFPCSFDFIWKWAKYSSKANAKVALRKLCVCGTDYVDKTGIDESIAVLVEEKHGGGHNRVDVMLTLRAAEHFLCQARTPQGALVRQYFINAEEKWQLLKENVESGRIRLEDKVTGEVVDNSLQDPKFIKNRCNAAVANVVKNQTMLQVFPNASVHDFIELNGAISEAVLGKRPRAFLRDNGLIAKKRRPDGKMVYPAHPNGRDVMSTTQLAGVTFLEGITSAMLKSGATFGQALEKCAEVKEISKVLHGTYCTPTNLEDVKDARRAMAIEM